MPREYTLSISPHRAKSLRIMLHGFSLTLRWALMIITVILFLLIAAATAPMFRGNRTIVILSGSMEPIIHTGAAVVAQPAPSRDLKVGDIIAFQPNADAPLPLVHRIVEIQDRQGVRYFRTRGDANNSEDTAEISLPVTAWRVWYSVPYAGYLIWFISQPLGTVILLVVPGVVLAALTAWDWLSKRGRIKPRLQNVTE